MQCIDIQIVIDESFFMSVLDQMIFLDNNIIIRAFIWIKILSNLFSLRFVWSAKIGHRGSALSSCVCANVQRASKRVGKQASKRAAMQPGSYAAS